MLIIGSQDDKYICLLQEEATREVMVNNQPVKVKNVYIEDRTAKCKVALWRSFTQEPVRPGEYVEITDLVTNVYRNEVSLQTTVRSSIKVSTCTKHIYPLR